MWANFLALGTLGFWIFAGAVFLLLIAAVEYEKPGWATLSLIVTCLALWLFGNVNVFALAVSDPLLTLELLAGYFAVGAIWSLAKWWFFVRRERERYDEARTAFLANHNLPSNAQIPANLKEIWQNQFSYGTSCKPKAQAHKGKILTWMIYWPWSCAWTVLNDPVKRLFKNIFNAMKALFQKVADSAYQDVEDDFVPPKEPRVKGIAEAASQNYGDTEDDMRPAPRGKSAK